MRPDRPSSTAAFVAALRAVGDPSLTGVRDFHDPTADWWLDPSWRVAAGAVRALGRSSVTRDWLRARFGGALATLPLRTLAIDAAVRECVQLGVTQLVLLGAGFDGRAYRMPELRAVDLFEVDHPATQAAKRARAAGHATVSRSHTYVPVDFTKQSLATQLAATTHDAAKPTAWVWEGVITYLDDAALRATLDAVVSRSARGSRLMAQYRAPVTDGGSGQALLIRFTRAVGEPQIGVRDTATMAREMERAGFAIVRDEGAEDWARAYGGGPLAQVGRTTRMVVGQW